QNVGTAHRYWNDVVYLPTVLASCSVVRPLYPRAAPVFPIHGRVVAGHCCGFAPNCCDCLSIERCAFGIFAEDSLHDLSPGRVDYSGDDCTSPSTLISNGIPTVCVVVANILWENVNALFD